MWFSRKPTPAPEPAPKREPLTMPTFPDGYVFTLRKSTEGEKQGERDAFYYNMSFSTSVYACEYRAEVRGPEGNLVASEGLDCLSEFHIIRAAHTLATRAKEHKGRLSLEAKYLGDYPPKTIPPTLTKEDKHV